MTDTAYPYYTEGAWHFPYRDQNRVLREITLPADNDEDFDSALAEAVKILNAQDTA